MRVGFGYDIHRVQRGRPLVLGGVVFEHHAGLLGHSDADVLCHAVADALLGAAGLGDIGVHFPPSEPDLEGISSLVILARVAALVADSGWRIANVDSCIVSEAPKVMHRALEMRTAMAGALGVAVERISVKATTNEGLGAIGRQEGMAAQAVALIEER